MNRTQRNSWDKGFLFRREWTSALMAIAWLAACRGSIFPETADASEKETAGTGDAAKPGEEATAHKSWWDREKLSGDWSGWRPRLTEHGVNLDASYTAEVLGALDGGYKRGAVYEGLGLMGVTVDPEKLFGGWKGTSFRISGMWIHGNSLTGKYVHDALTASNIDAFDSIRLYELWIQQMLFSDKVSIKIGNQLADAEFAGTDNGALFLNSAFGWPAFISGNTLNTGPAFFVTGLGARVRVEATEKVFVQAGVYDGDTFDNASGDPKTNPNGLRWHLGGSQGFFSMLEMGYKLNQEKDAKGLPGTYKFGGWYHTGPFVDNYFDSAGGSAIVTGQPFRPRDGNFGLYFAMDQTLWRGESHSHSKASDSDAKPSADAEAGAKGEGEADEAPTLAAFLRAGFSPPDRSAYEFCVDGGFNFKGLIPSRPSDVFGVGVVYARVSQDVRRQQQDDLLINGTPGVVVSDHEIVIESSYKMELTPWCHVQPDVQYIIHPGASSQLPNAWVAGLRAVFDF